MVAIPVVILAMYAAFAVGAVIGWLLGVLAESRRVAYNQNSQALSFVVNDIASKEQAMREAMRKGANVPMQPIGELPQPAGKPWRGCRACHGSGGKRSEPCVVCNGSGKLDKFTNEPYDSSSPTNGS